MKNLCILSVLLIIAAEPNEDAGKKDLKALQGTWTMAALEVDGKDVPLNRINGTILKVKGNEYVVHIKDRQHAVTISLDPSQNPRELDMVPVDGANKDKVHKAIYKIESDTLTICRGLNPEQPRPREFATWPDTSYFVVKWKKQP